MCKNLEEIENEADEIFQELCDLKDIIQIVYEAEYYSDNDINIIPILEVTIEKTEKTLERQEQLGQNILKLRLKKEGII